ncbi:MAG: hypothetical protein ABIW81_01320, partial [Terrimesophilobacter sp.]
MSIARRSILRRRAAKVATAVLLLTLASFGLSAPAQAASPGIEFSTDGVTYAPVFTGSLFKDITLVVPGDTQSST